jgi:hypothetical protein
VRCSGRSIDPIRTIVRDNRGGFVEVLTYLEIVAPTANNPPTVTAFANPAGAWRRQQHAHRRCHGS